MQTAPLIEPREPNACATLAPLVAPMVERARAFMDLNPASSTYGCADRAFWYYRTLTNLSGATWQQTMLGLAALYRTLDRANPCFGDGESLEAVGAALDYWSRIGHRDGAYDEWYLNEHSYCPTAITGAGAALTLDLIGGELSPARRDAGLAALRKTGTWLEPRFNPTVMNQNLAAAVALAGLARLDGGARWREAAQRKLARVRAEQSAEGWLPEYSGADLGYSTLALDFLAAFHRLSGADMAQDMAAKLCAFLIAAQGGWRTLAGRLGSRGTAHMFPFGALYFAGRDANAARLAATWLESLAHGRAPRPAAVDDRYFAYFYFPQFALAYHQAAQGERLASPAVLSTNVLDLPDSGFLAVRRSDWSALISRRLGGAVAVSDAKGALVYHCGYEVVAASGKRCSSAAWRNTGVCASPDAAGDLLIEAAFRPASSGLPLKRFMAPFQLAVGFLATSRLAEAFQTLIKSRMIAPEGDCGLALERRIAIDEAGLRVRDTLKPAAGLPRIAALDVARAISMHSPSARQDRARVIELGETALAKARDALNAGRSTTIAIRIDGASGAAQIESVA